jgi:hypothetical protein
VHLSVKTLRHMPVAELKAVLAAPGPDARHELISKHLGRLETQLAQTQAAVGELQDLLGRTQGEQPVEHGTVAPTSALVIHEVDVLDW